MSSDHELVQLLGELIDVPPEQRQAWLEHRLPDAPAERARLLAAVVDDAEAHEAESAASDGAAASASPSHTSPFRFAVPATAIGASLPATIDRYEVISLLGHGGMGAVYLARDPLMDRQVAVKVLGIAGGVEYRQRFLREARAAGGLRHRNIVTIYDVGEAPQGPFIVMERIPGRTLHDLLAAGQPPTLSARLAILEDVCNALEAAHQRGIVHRDIKPSNVMVDQDDVVKVLDFGVAKPMADAVALTKDRLVVGTVGYMSPEQAAAGAVDARSDVYSIAVLAYEFLTSHRPFEPHVSALAPGLAAILRRGMATLPADRYQSAAALGRALAGFRAQALAEEANPTLASADIGLPSKPGGAVASGEPARARAQVSDTGLPSPDAPARARTSKAIVVSAAVAAMLALAVLAWMYLGPQATPAAGQAEGTGVQTPGNTTLSRPALDNTVPNSTVPENVVPDNTVPGRTPPTSPAPVNTAPVNTAPVNTAPVNTAPSPSVAQSPASAPRVEPSSQRPAARQGNPPGGMSAACRALLAQTSLGEPLTEAQRTIWERNCVS